MLNTRHFVDAASMLLLTFVCLTTFAPRQSLALNLATPPPDAVIEDDSAAEEDWPQWRLRNFFLKSVSKPSAKPRPVETLSSHVRDHFFLQSGDLADSLTIEEAAWSLLGSGQLNVVGYEIDEFAPREADIYFLIIEQDQVNLISALNIGGGQEDIRLTQLLPQALPPDEGSWAGLGLGKFGIFYSSENCGSFGASVHVDLPIQARGISSSFGIEIESFLEADSISPLFSWSAEISKPFRTPYDSYSYGLRTRGQAGAAFDYRRAEAVIQDVSPRVEAWFSRAFIREDRFFVTGLAGFIPLATSGNDWREAAEGSGYVLLGFSSLAQEYTSAGLTSYMERITPLGAVGSVAFGKFFPVGSNGEHFVYAGGQAASSAMLNNEIYVYGMLGAGSGFRDGAARYTHLKTEGLGHIRLQNNLLVAGRVRQQTSWNWPAQRQAILDNHSGLRGFDANLAVGDNSLLSSLELRWMPFANPLLTSPLESDEIELEAALFYDAGVIWNLDQQIADQRVLSAAGLGLRLFHSWWGNRNVIRLDLAYNVNAAEVGQVILSTRMPFNLFGSHDFELPKMIDTEIDRR